MNQLQVFNYEEQDVRMVIIDGVPWWVLKDVCRVLGVGNARDVVRRLDKDEKGVVPIDTLGGRQEMNVVNESGLYAVILRSDKPNAKKFRRWITHEVLPTIRKTGGYIQDGSQSDFLIKTVSDTVTRTIAEQLPNIIAQTVRATLEVVTATTTTGVMGANGITMTDCATCGCGHGCSVIETNNQTRPSKTDKRYAKYKPVSKMELLPREVRDEVLEMLFSRQYTYMEITRKLKDDGHDVSLSGVGRYALKIYKTADGFGSVEFSR